jgi:MFS transporter, AAHS family, 4-hydroxybenzoate transporter
MRASGVNLGATTAGRVVEISSWIDRRKVSTSQVIVLLLCGCAILLDGFDAQVIGYVAPAIIKDLQIPPASLAGVFSAGTFGILIGCLFVAPLADWLGRRLLIIASVAEFSAFTLATATVHTLEGLLIMRFLTGIGLGACMSNVVALTSEYVPSRLRAAMTTWMFCGYPIGAFIAGLVVANLSATYGWRDVFILGGVLPLVLAVLAIFLLPESLYYLAGRKGAALTIVRILRRIDPQEQFSDSTIFISGEHREPGLTVKHLFRDGRGFGTILLWIMFFTMLVEVFLLTSWTPTLLNRAGMSLSSSVITMALVQGGGVISLLCLGPLFDRLGFASTLVPLFVVATVAIAVMGNSGTSPVIIMTAAFLAGAGVMGGQSSLIVLAGMFYPSFIRSTGVGWALGMGRFGAIVGPLIGGLMVQKQWELGSIFIAASTLPLIVGAALLVMNRVARVGSPKRADPRVALETTAPETP